MRTQLVQPCLGILFQAWTGPSASKRLRLPRFLDSRHMMVVKLSAVRTGRLSPGDMPGTHFCYVTGRNMSMKYPLTQSGIEPATLQLVAQ